MKIRITEIKGYVDVSLPGDRTASRYATIGSVDGTPVSIVGTLYAKADLEKAIVEGLAAKLGMEGEVVKSSLAKGR